jgi:5-formyltetrahydrofolate cyclo-ligase
MKTKLRSEKKLERLSHHPDQKKDKDILICKRLRRLSVFSHAKRILFYLPIHGEVDLSSLHKGAMHPKEFILPRVKDERTLHLYHINGIDDVETGKYNILEPKTHLKRAKPAEIDLVLVPGVVYSKNGHRIGYGKGFYDRLLKKIKCPKIGIAYEFQMVENIDGEPHDTPMDVIVTEKKTYHIKKP